MSRQRVLFLDDVREPYHVFGKDCDEKYDFTIVRTCAEALDVVALQPTYDLWSLDHDLGMKLKEQSESGLVLSAAEDLLEPSGYDFLKLVTNQHPEKYPAGRVRVHSANVAGSANMRAYCASYEKHLQSRG